MSNGPFRNVCYFLLLLIEFVLNTIFSVAKSVYSVSALILFKLLHINMTEISQKKRKNGSNDSNLLKARTLIDANWQKFLSSGLINDKKSEKSPQETTKQHYTGTFRRSRKKKTNEHQTCYNAQNGSQNLNIDIVTLKNDLNNKNLASFSDQKLIKNQSVSKNAKTNLNGVAIKNNDQKNKLTKFIAMDCEMVGIGYDGNDHMLARVSLVNKFGDCIYDKFVKPREEVIDYRTNISGVRKEDLLNGDDFTKVQKEVAEIIRGKILVGHSLKNDLSVLFLSHPKRNIRDTARYKPFRKITKGSTPSLKRLAKEILGIDIQHAEHSSVEDARAVMQLYCTVAKNWEASMSEKRGYNGKILDES
ncbi:RNA exonuclease 4 [Hyposmocoma kahamanoa]|uniref:RNA exonuclease 4 n=1 Tax=Hyposmocoma kahamanoa TaxID=1477025 RepID=UPI000E6D9025|nr:RNA exonuclease 4 [Hyposmocoma kahamanoa]